MADAWVSVNERLPDIDNGRWYSRRVLVVVDYRPHGGSCTVQFDRLERHSTGEMNWEAHDGEPVTHWRELPAPPKETANG